MREKFAIDYTAQENTLEFRFQVLDQAFLPQKTATPRHRRNVATRGLLGCPLRSEGR